MVLLGSEPIETFDPIYAANLWVAERARRPAYQRNLSKKVAPPLLVEESLMEIYPPFTSLSTCDLSSGDEDECDNVYTSYSTDESSDESDDCGEDDE